MVLGGELTALRLCLERKSLPRKDALVTAATHQGFSYPI